MTINKNKIITLSAMALFVLVGTYNSVVMNSYSLVSGSDIKFVKRLDELQGLSVPGRGIAETKVSWQRLGPAKMDSTLVRSIQIPTPSDSMEETDAKAAIQSELGLSLIEVTNSAKWPNGLAQGQFNGSLSARNGVIESLLVSLPGEEGLSVAFSSMSGNVFEYDFNGELFSGMMYQVDEKAYMVTLTNGPLAGTQLRFSNEKDLETGNVEVGSTDSVELNRVEDSARVNDQLMQKDAEQFNSNQASVL